MKLDKNKKKKLAIFAAFVGVILYFTSLQEETLEDQRTKVEVEGGTTKTYSELTLEQSGISVKKEILNLKDMQEKLAEAISKIKVSGGSNLNITKTEDGKQNFFKKKVEMTLGQSFVSNNGFFYIQNRDDVKKYIYTNGVEKKILGESENKRGKNKTEFLLMEDRTFKIFPNDTTLYYLINGDELYIENINGEDNIYIITKDGKLVKNLKRDEDIENKIQKSIKNTPFKSGSFVIIDKSNQIIENGIFDKYFFQGKQYKTAKKQNIQKNILRFLTEKYTQLNDLHKIEYSLLTNEEKIYLKKQSLYSNDTKLLENIEDLFIDKFNNKIIVKHEGQFFSNNLKPRITYLKTYTNEFGNIFNKTDEGIISKIKLNGTTENLGKGNIVLLPNGEVKIEIVDKDLRVTTLEEGLGERRKFYLCYDEKYAIESENIIETFDANDKLINRIENPKIEIVNEELVINEEPFCKLKEVNIKSTNDSKNVIHDGATVLDEDGNRYIEKDGRIYKIDKDGNIEEIGKGKINRDGTITLDDGTKIDTEFETKTLEMVEDDKGNKYFEKDGKIFKIDKDGNIEEIGKGKINRDGTVILDNGQKIDTKFETKDNIVTDDKGNRYFEKDGKIFKIDKDGNVTNLGDGKINKDGSISLKNGDSIDTKFNKTKNKIVKDKDGNRYFEKNGNIYKIDKDGNVTRIGKGKINKEGGILLDNGSVIDTVFDSGDNTKLLQLDKNGKIIDILEGIEYQYKNGNLLIDHYLLKNEPILDLNIENLKSYTDFAGKNSIEISAKRVLQTNQRNWSDYTDFKDTSISKENDTILLKQNDKNVYIDTVKTISNYKTKIYLFSEDKKLFIFPNNEMFFEDKTGKLTYLDKNLFDIIINENKYIISIKKKIDLSSLTSQQNTEDNVEIVYTPNNDELLYIKNNKIINREKGDKLFNTKVKKYQINMTEPEKMNNKFIIFTENGSELTYVNSNVRYINQNGKVEITEGNLYLTKNKDEVILRQQGSAKSFKIKYINVKNNTIVKTQNAAYILDKDNIVGVYVKDNIYKKLNGSFGISIDKLNNVTIKGPENISGGKLVEVLHVDNEDFVITEIIKKGDTPIIKEQPVDYEKIMDKQKQYLEEQLKLMKSELEKKLEKPEPEKKETTINYDLDLIKMNRLFSNKPDPKNGQQGRNSYSNMMGQLMLSKISDEDLKKLLKENNLAEAEATEQKLIIPIGTKFYAKIEEAVEVPVISSGNGGTSDVSARFKGIKISRISTPRGDEVNFSNDALMLGTLKGNRANERIYIYPESVNWYNEEEDKYLRIDLSGATKVSSKKDKIEGIPGLFINKKMDNIIMSAGLELVKGITEAIVASQNPMNSMMNPDMGSLMGTTSSTTDPAISQNLAGAALGGAGSSFEEIIDMIKEDMEGLIPFLVSNEGEDIVITITKDLVVEEREGE